MQNTLEAVNNRFFFENGAVRKASSLLRKLITGSIIYRFPNLKNPLKNALPSLPSICSLRYGEEFKRIQSTLHSACHHSIAGMVVMSVLFPIIMQRVLPLLFHIRQVVGH